MLLTSRCALLQRRLVRANLQSLYSYRKTFASSFTSTVKNDSEPATEMLPSHVKLRMPDLHFEQLSSNSKGYCKLVKWLVQEGEPIQENAAVCEIETPDLLFTLESADAGYVAKIFVEASTENVPVGRPLAAFVPNSQDIQPFVEALGKWPHLIEGYQKKVESEKSGSQNSEGLTTCDKESVEAVVVESESIKLLRLLKSLHKQGNFEDDRVLKTLKSLARNGDERLLVTFNASFSVGSQGDSEFDCEYFVENAKELAEEIMKQE